MTSCELLSLAWKLKGLHAKTPPLVSPSLCKRAHCFLHQLWVLKDSWGHRAAKTLWQLFDCDCSVSVHLTFSFAPVIVTPPVRELCHLSVILVHLLKRLIHGRVRSPQTIKNTKKKINKKWKQSQNLPWLINTPSLWYIVVFSIDNSDNAYFLSYVMN